MTPDASWTAPSPSTSCMNVPIVAVVAYIQRLRETAALAIRGLGFYFYIDKIHATATVVGQ